MLPRCGKPFDPISIHLISDIDENLASDFDGSLSGESRFTIYEIFLTSGVNFINVLRTAFTLVDSESIKNTVKSSVSLYTFGIYEHKSCT